MRRRPQTHDHEQPHRGNGVVPCCSRVPDQRRHGAGGAAEDDVLRTAALEVAGVDDDVEEVPDEREHRGEEVRRCEQRERRGRGRKPELERARRRQSFRRDGPPGSIESGETLSSDERGEDPHGVPPHVPPKAPYPRSGLIARLLGRLGR